MNIAAKLQRKKQSQWTDERLVSECLNGNQEAWSALIDRYKNLIYSVPIKLRMYDDAPDIFQAVCVDLLAGLKQVREPRALPKWLMQATYHKCLQFRRKAENNISLTNEAGEELPLISEQPLPERMMAELEKEQMVRDAISQLNARCAEMVRLLFYENPPRPYQEVARKLDIATGSIGFIRGRCLKKLKKQLEELGF
ncbi:MAG TPA: sigma-70 family RNA polymerase sigma factor [Terriglobales bacterium]|nr:sigma-70 family RNA polymerase sigma factor [Terriglobales bacterium]